MASEKQYAIAGPRLIRDLYDLDKLDKYEKAWRCPENDHNCFRNKYGLTTSPHTPYMYEQYEKNTALLKRIAAITGYTPSFRFYYVREELCISDVTFPIVVSPDKKGARWKCMKLIVNEHGGSCIQYSAFNSTLTGSCHYSQENFSILNTKLKKLQKLLMDLGYMREMGHMGMEEYQKFIRGGNRNA